MREGFNSILDLVPMAEKIKQLHAICKLCHHQASFTFRTAASDSLELIGGQDTYMPLCREFYNFETEQQRWRAEEAAQASNNVSEVTYRRESIDEGDDDGSKLIVSVRKSDTSPESQDYSAQILV